LLVIYTPSHVCSARNPGLACRLAEGLAPKRETRVTLNKVDRLQGGFNCNYST
jgi:hypothetical protein